jgi:hypothetical protein
MIGARHLSTAARAAARGNFVRRATEPMHSASLVRTVKIARFAALALWRAAKRLCRRQRA